MAPERGAGRAICYVDGEPGALRHAALLNATASHSVEFDDIYRDAGYHPGCPTIGAALAAAQSRGATPGRRCCAPSSAGYEVSCRIGVAVQPSHYRYWHTTGTVGTFGAAAATALLLGCDAERTAHAIATAATFAGGLQQAFRSSGMSKPLHPGHAADAGALAAIGAAAGVTGALDVLHGPVGFAAATSEDTGKWDKALGGPGRALRHHRHDLQEPRLLRPHLRRPRRRGRPPGGARLRRRRTSRPSTSAATARPRRSATGPAVGTEQEARFSAQYCIGGAPGAGRRPPRRLRARGAGGPAHPRPHAARHRLARPGAGRRLPRPPRRQGDGQAARRARAVPLPADPQGRPRRAALRRRALGEVHRARGARDRRRRRRGRCWTRSGTATPCPARCRCWPTAERAAPPSRNGTGSVRARSGAATRKGRTRDDRRTGRAAGRRRRRGGHPADRGLDARPAALPAGDGRSRNACRPPTTTTRRSNGSRRTGGTDRLHSARRRQSHARRTPLPPSRSQGICPNTRHASEKDGKARPAQLGPAPRFRGRQGVCPKTRHADQSGG